MLLFQINLQSGTPTPPVCMGFLAEGIPAMIVGGDVGAFDADGALGSFDADSEL